MATFNQPIITTQGQAMLKATISGQAELTFTKVVFSSDDLTQSSDTDIASLTDIQTKDLTATAQTFVGTDGTTKIRAIADNQSSTQAFYIKDYALYAKQNGNETLFAISISDSANFVPAYSAKQLSQIAYTFNFAISDKANITLSDVREVPVSQADIKGVTTYVDSQVTQLNNSINNLDVSSLTDAGTISDDFDFDSSQVIDHTENAVFQIGGKMPKNAPQTLTNLYGTILLVEHGVQTQIIISGSMWFRVATDTWKNDWTKLDDTNKLYGYINNNFVKNDDLKSAVNNINANIDNNNNLINSLQGNALQYKGTLTANDDVNNIENGIHVLNTQKPKNMPADFVQSWGSFGTIIQYGDNNYSAQLASSIIWNPTSFENDIGNNSVLMYRTKINGWNKWRTIATESNIIDIQNQLNSAINNINNNISHKADQSSLSTLSSNALTKHSYKFQNGENVLDVKNMADGYYLANGISNCPIKYGIIEKLSFGDDTIIRVTETSSGNIASIGFSYGTQKWSDWQQLGGNNRRTS